MDTGFSGKQAFNSEQLTVNTATTLTASKYDGPTVGSTSGREMALPPVGGKATAAVVEVLANDIYYTLDGSVPSGTTGHVLGVGDVLPLVGYAKIKALKLIKGPGAANATVTITYYRG